MIFDSIYIYIYIYIYISRKLRATKCCKNIFQCSIPIRQFNTIVLFFSCTLLQMVMIRFVIAFFVLVTRDKSRDNRIFVQKDDRLLVIFVNTFSLANGTQFLIRLMV